MTRVREGKSNALNEEGAAWLTETRMVIGHTLTQFIHGGQAGRSRPEAIARRVNRITAALNTDRSLRPPNGCGKARLCLAECGPLRTQQLPHACTVRNLCALMPRFTCLRPRTGRTPIGQSETL